MTRAAGGLPAVVVDARDGAGRDPSGVTAGAGSTPGYAGSERRRVRGRRSGCGGRSGARLPPAESGRCLRLRERRPPGEGRAKLRPGRSVSQGGEKRRGNSRGAAFVAVTPITEARVTVADGR